MVSQSLRSISNFSRWRYYRRYTPYKLALVTLLIVLLSYIPMRLVLTSIQFPQPQAILTLGGRPAREAFTAEFAQSHPDLNIWISSGMNPAKAQPFFALVGVDLRRITFDFRATDTVTNFTTLVNEFDRLQIHHVYLITSDFHMARARAIAAIVFGSRGIITTPVIVPSRVPPESKVHILRDVGRSIVWLFTQRTGASLRSQSWAATFR
ncbi:MAG: ElyC/SanA/YdcF family protein [Oculatellaceae cyanobacterium bins.114]|nr:ElyC/SanA/YdcF family protein [Oculatellaceae cyanobacterium bins.114]